MRADVWVRCRFPCFRNNVARAYRSNFAGLNNKRITSAKPKTTPNSKVAWAMLDFIMLLLVVVCFVLASAYASLCDRLLALPGRAPDKDVAS